EVTVVPSIEQYEAEQNENRRHYPDVERQHLDYQRRAEVGSQHDCQARNQVQNAAGGKRRRHQSGRSAALQSGSDRQSDQKRIQTMVEAMSEPAPEVAAITAQHSGGDHVRAPQEQPHITREIK